MPISCNQSNDSQQVTTKEIESEFHLLRGPYLGQEPPGDSPKIFAPHLISAGYLESSISFTPDGSEFCYSIATKGGRYLADPPGLFRSGFMLNSYIVDGHWSEPTELPFALEYRSRYPVFSPDGNRIYFNCNREGAVQPDSLASHIWYADRIDDGWSEMKEIVFNDGYNLKQNGVYPGVAANGNLYYTVFPDGVSGILFRSTYQNGHYSAPERLNDLINHHRPVHTFVAPDESYIIFDDDPPVDKFGGSDLYISFRDKNGEWMKPNNLGEKINTVYWERRPFVTGDGKYLFFASNRILNTETPPGPVTLKQIKDATNVPEDGTQHIYWVDAQVIEDLRPE